MFVLSLLYIVLGMWFAYLDPLTHGHVEATKAELALLTDSSGTNMISINSFKLVFVR